MRTTCVFGMNNGQVAMNTDQLQTFVVLARTGSFTKAAAELNLSQPAVSRHIQKLEHELGVPLLDQRRGRIELSEAGERLLTFADEVIEGRRRLMESLGHGPRALEGELRIAASTTPGEFLVPGLVAAFTKRHPRVTTQVLIADSSEVPERLRSRRYDIGFSGVELADKDLYHQEVATDEIVLAVPAKHPFAGRASVELRELAGQPFVMREPGSGTFMSFQSALRGMGAEMPPYRTVMVLSTTTAVVSAVASGFGLGLVSLMALDARGPGGPVAVRIEGIPLRRCLYLVLERERALPPAPSAFCTWVMFQTGNGDRR